MKKLDLVTGIRPFLVRLKLDILETQVLMHYTRIPIETLKRRYSRARSDRGKLLLKAAIEFNKPDGGHK